MDPLDIAKALPLKKYATTVQLVALALAVLMLIGLGWYMGSVAKQYFDAGHQELLVAIQKVDNEQTTKNAAVVAQVGSMGTEIDKNSARIDAIAHYYWSNADMTRWAAAFDRANRLSVPAMIVPEVPPPPPQAPAH